MGPSIQSWSPTGAEVSFPSMRSVVLAVGAFLRSLFRTRMAVQQEILALRHQIAVLQRSVKRPRLGPADRILWAWLSRIWPGWKGSLVLVRPATVVEWRRRKSREHWARLSHKRNPGRPAIPGDIRDLIRRMSRANPTWGSPRIVGELAKIGIVVAKSTVETYMVRQRKPPSPTWRAVLNNHVRDFVAMDFFVVATVRFQVLFVLIVTAHHRPRVVHFNVTDSPSPAWTAQQIIEVFPRNTAPRYLLRDRDGIYGPGFRQRIANMGIDQVLISPRSPWQNPFCERLIGTIRRDCLDHVIVFHERHLRRLLCRYFEYYHKSRTHLAIDMDCPKHRAVQTPDMGEVVQIPQVGGLHHRYERRTA